MAEATLPTSRFSTPSFSLQEPTGMADARRAIHRRAQTEIVRLKADTTY